MIFKTKEELMLFALKKFLDKPKIETLKLFGDKTKTPMELSKTMRCSPPLMSYYLNGNKKSEGLLELGLIARTHDEQGKTIGFRITDLGREVLKIL